MAPCRPSPARPRCSSEEASVSCPACVRRSASIMEVLISASMKPAYHHPSGWYREDGASELYVDRVGKLVRRTLGGDEIVAEWSAEDPGSVRAAADAMRREVDAGYTAMEGGEGRNQPVDELPPDASVVILTMPMGGG